MKKQNFQKDNQFVVEKFKEMKKQGKQTEIRTLNFSWSNWGFGTESFETSVKRLAENNVKFIELHGNRYGKDLGYKASEIKKILDYYDIKVSGVCGMVSPSSEVASNSPFIRQRSIDYFRRNIELCSEMGGKYILFSPGAVGRPDKYDNNEYERAAETIHAFADDLVQSGVKGALEPVRPEEVSLCHTFDDAVRLIEMIDHPGIKHIAGDIFHMLVGEEHIGKTIIEHGDKLINLHVADTNRQALGTGMMDLDIIIMALYVIGYNSEESFVTAEPLGVGGNPYQALNEYTEPEKLDDLVRQTASYFYERESELLEATEADLNMLI